MDDRPEIGEILGIFADRAVVELERMAVEDALQESEERYSLVFDQQFQFMVILSPEGRILRINDLPLRIQGAAREEFVGKYFWQCPAWQGLPDQQKIIKSRIEQVSKIAGIAFGLGHGHACGPRVDWHGCSIDSSIHIASA